MRDTYGKLEQRFEFWDHFTSQLKSNPGSYNDVINQTNTSRNLTYGVWNILKDHHTYESTHAVHEQRDMDTKTTRKLTSQRLICYRAKKDVEEECCIPKDPKKPEKNPDPKSVTPKASCLKCPLNKNLQKVDKAVLFEKCCAKKINDLMETQQKLRQQIELMEKTEIEISNKMKEAQFWWNSMEANYKSKIENAFQKVNNSLQAKTEIDSSIRKWRLNKKNLEFEIAANIKRVNDFKEYMKTRIDKLECTKNDVKELRQKIEATNNQIEIVNLRIYNKKNASNDKIKSLSAEIAKIKKLVQEENKTKRDKQLEGNKYANETRDDLHKIYRAMLHFKLQNEHLRTQKEAIQNEIDLKKINAKQIKEKIKNKEKQLSEEIAKVDSEIAKLKVTCTACAKCVDTSDVKNFCTDCPRCDEERSRLRDGSRSPNVGTACPCTSVKEKLMNNVFKNMHTVLENRIDTTAGRNAANAVLCSLKKSRDGKLDEKTRKMLHDFVLTTVKNNVNTTIISGAMKTKCEMKSDTLNQLMLCLECIKKPQALEEDTSSDLSKEPCRCSSTECVKNSTSSNACPKMPREFDPKVSPSVADEVIWCPHKKTTMGTNCCIRAEVMSQCNTLKEVKKLRRTPCNNDSCPNNMRNVRAAQCILGEESLYAHETALYNAKVPHAPEVLMIYNQGVSKYRSPPKKSILRHDAGPKYQKEVIDAAMPMRRYSEKTTNINVRCTMVNDETTYKRSTRRGLGPKYQKGAIEESSARYAEKMTNLHIRCALVNDESVYKRSSFVESSRCILSRA